MRRSLLTLAIGAALFQPQAYANSAATVPAEARSIDATVSAGAAGSLEVIQFVRLFSWAGVQLDPAHALPFLATANAQPAPTLLTAFDHPYQPASSDTEWLRWVRSHVRSE